MLRCAWRNHRSAEAAWGQDCAWPRRTRDAARPAVRPAPARSGVPPRQRQERKLGDGPGTGPPMHIHAGRPAPEEPRRSPLRCPRSPWPRSLTPDDGKDRIGIRQRYEHQAVAGPLAKVIGRGVDDEVDAGRRKSLRRTGAPHGAKTQVRAGRVRPRSELLCGGAAGLPWTGSSAATPSRPGMCAASRSTDRPRRLDYGRGRGPPNARHDHRAQTAPAASVATRLGMVRSPPSCDRGWPSGDKCTRGCS